eukprot:gene12459-biopygen19952
MERCSIRNYVSVPRGPFPTFVCRGYPTKRCVFGEIGLRTFDRPPGRGRLRLPDLRGGVSLLRCRDSGPAARFKGGVFTQGKTAADADRTRGARYNLKERTRTGRGPDADVAVSPGAGGLCSQWRCNNNNKSVEFPETRSSSFVEAGGPQS